MPFLVISVEGALRAADARFEDAAATLGADRWTTFRRVTLPLVAPGIARRRGALLGPGAGRVRRDDHLRRQLPRARRRPCRWRSTWRCSATPRRRSSSRWSCWSSRWPRCCCCATGGWAGRAARRMSLSARVASGGDRSASTSRSRSPTARCSPSSARTARASPRCCACSPGCCRPTAARVVARRRHGLGRRRRARARRTGGRWAWSSRTTCCSRTSRSPTTWPSGCGPAGVGRPRPRAAAARLARPASGWTASATGGPGSSPAARRSGRRWPARWWASPRVLLLDEPLSALDARTRLTVRAELRRHLAEFAGSTVLVTHDPVDAMALADRVVVVEDGRVVQEGTPAEVSRAPAHRLRGPAGRAVAAARHRGRARPCGWTAAARSRSPRRPSGPVFAAVRPESVALYLSRPDGQPAQRLAGHAGGRHPARRHGALRAGRRGAADRRRHGDRLRRARARARGATVWATVKASEVAVYAR